MTRPATFAQQAAYDRMMDVARALQADREPTAEELEDAADALALLRLEPQPPGFLEALEALLAAIGRRAP